MFAFEVLFLLVGVVIKGEAIPISPPNSPCARLPRTRSFVPQGTIIAIFDGLHSEAGPLAPAKMSPQHYCTFSFSLVAFFINLQLVSTVALHTNSSS